MFLLKEALFLFFITEGLNSLLFVKQEAIMLDLLRVISHHRARLATPIRTVQKIYSDADLENVPFTDGVFSNSRAPANRSFLLIEPPAYKINGDDKAKPSTRTSNVRANEEKDSKVEASNSTTESKGAPVSATDMKRDEKVASTSGSGSPSIKSTVTSAADRKDQNIEPSTSTQAKPELQNQAKENKKVDGLKEMLRAGELQDESSAAAAASSGSGKAENHPSTSPQKPETKPRPPLEENIVLGVALEGSKRTLPIEEEKVPTAGPVEPKELTAQRNASGPLPRGKDKNDGQVKP